MISEKIERFIFWSRWLLSPLYVGLIGVMAVLVYKFLIEFWLLITHVSETEGHQFTLDLLALLDLVLLGNLILIVLFAGYENFVSKIDAAQNSVDRPAWMGHVDFSGLKIKLIGSLVAISVIELLKDFIEIGANPDKEIPVTAIFWQVMIHLTFVISGVLFAVMDWISDHRVIRGMEHEHRLVHNGDESKASETEKHAAENRKSRTVL